MNNRDKKKHIISISSIVLLLTGVLILIAGILIDMTFKSYALRLIIDLFFVVAFFFAFFGIYAIILDLIKYYRDED